MKVSIGVIHEGRRRLSVLPPRLAAHPKVLVFRTLKADVAASTDGNFSRPTLQVLEEKKGRADREFVKGYGQPDGQGTGLPDHGAGRQPSAIAD